MPHLDQNLLGPLRRGSPGLDSGPIGRPLFRRCTALSAARSLCLLFIHPRAPNLISLRSAGPMLASHMVNTSERPRFWVARAGA